MTILLAWSLLFLALRAGVDRRELSRPLRIDFECAEERDAIGVKEMPRVPRSLMPSSRVGSSSRFLRVALGSLLGHACGVGGDHERSHDQVPLPNEGEGEQLASASLPPGEVIGVIDSGSMVGAEFEINGWACQRNVAESIHVHVYLDGPAGVGAVYRGHLAADLLREQAVSTACGTSGVRHHFRVRMPAADVAAHQGKAVFVHGIRAAGSVPNALLGHSGRFSLPASGAAYGEVRGHVDSAAIVGGELSIQGWACQQNVSQSISVHVYVGGPAGRGEQVRSHPAADGVRESAVGAACGTSGIPHHFNARLTYPEMVQHQGKAIYVHGIRAVGEVPNAVLGSSGAFVVPAAPIRPRRLSEVAVAGQDLVIPAGDTVEIDQSVELDLVTVNGTLRCPATGRYRIETTGMMIHGLFECGTASAPFGGELDLVVRGGREQTMGALTMGERTISVMRPGVLSLHGLRDKSGWRRLAATAGAGARELTVEPGSSPIRWRAGDRLAIGPSGYDPFEAEAVTVASVSGTTIRTVEPLRFSHHGVIQRVESRSGPRILDERAEVANLSRNIRIYPAGEPSTHHCRNFQGNCGAHIMVMRGARAHIDSVELVRMGRMSELGRYPFHWHLVGDATGQYIRNSSIHTAYQRCVVVHGTDNALVENNVCFDHFGHGYFLEDGNERGNQIVGNLGILSKRIPRARALLESDIAGNALRFSAPSTFWISNPDNHVVGNVASGSQGSGFWMAFQAALTCGNGGCTTGGPSPNVRPLTTNTLRFDDNWAHATEVGITWDGAPDGSLTNNPNNPGLDRQLVEAHYQPPTIPVFNDLVTFKNLNTGIYFRGGTAEFRRATFANNGWSMFFAFHQIVRDSIVVGRSQSVDDRDLQFRRNRRPQHEFGIVLYDGPFELHDVDFIDFPAQRLTFGGADLTPIPFGAIGGANRFTNATRSVRFTPEPSRRMFLPPNLNWHDSPWSMSLRDTDGSLTGSAGAVVVPDHPFNHVSGVCTERASWGAQSCGYRVGLVILTSSVDPLRFPFRVTRSDGVSTVSSPSALQGALHRKFNMVLGRGFEYTLEFPPGYAAPNGLAIFFQAETLGANSPVMHIRGLGCSLQGVPKLGSLNEVRRATGAAQFVNGADVSLKLQTSQGGGSSMATVARTGHAFSCP